jgi:protocatechuate 3,4-dioxygenase alpha subunit
MSHPGREREGARPVATPSQTVGPFFHFGLASNPALGRMAPREGAGEPMALRVQVLDGDGAPVPDALIELYQSDGSGRYAQPGFSGFGRLPTDERGSCVFNTIRPGAVPDGRGGLLARHVNVCVFARGLLRHVYTRLYFPDDDRLDTDPILSLVAPDRRGTLIARAAAGEEGTWEWVIRLQGDRETVFFDL